MAAKNYYVALGDRIRRAREEAGYSQEQLARMLGMTGAGFTLWEKGKRRIPLDVLERLAVILGQPIQYFVGQNVSVEDKIVHELRQMKQAQRDLALRLLRTVKASQLGGEDPSHVAVPAAVTGGHGDWPDEEGEDDLFGNSSQNERTEKTLLRLSDGLADHQASRVKKTLRKAPVPAFLTGPPLVYQTAAV